MISINDLKKDLLEYDLYYLLDCVQYGDYFLTIINENDSIIIHIEDVEGSASYGMSREEFLNIKTTEELKLHINSIIYYNYIEYEGE